MSSDLAGPQPCAYQIVDGVQYIALSLTLKPTLEVEKWLSSTTLSVKAPGMQQLRQFLRRLCECEEDKHVAACAK